MAFISDYTFLTPKKWYVALFFFDRPLEVSQRRDFTYWMSELGHVAMPLAFGTVNKPIDPAAKDAPGMAGATSYFASYVAPLTENVTPYSLSLSIHTAALAASQNTRRGMGVLVGDPEIAANVLNELNNLPSSMIGPVWGSQALYSWEANRNLAPTSFYGLTVIFNDAPVPSRDDVRAKLAKAYNFSFPQLPADTGSGWGELNGIVDYVRTGSLPPTPDEVAEFLGAREAWFEPKSDNLEEALDWVSRAEESGKSALRLLANLPVDLPQAGSSILSFVIKNAVPLTIAGVAGYLFLKALPLIEEARYVRKHGRRSRYDD
jgi:hypothetical protein